MKFSDTMKFESSKDKSMVKEILMGVYFAMKEKGYDPINQIVGYLISGDPTYITSYKNARYMIGLIERDELVEELVRFYVNGHNNGEETGSSNLSE